MGRFKKAAKATEFTYGSAPTNEEFKQIREKFIEKTDPSRNKKK